MENSSRTSAPHFGSRSASTATYIFLSRLIGLAANVATVIIISRYLGREVFGHYAFVMAYSLLIGTLATGGTFTIVIRESAKDLSKAGHNLGTALQVQTLFTLAAAALSVVLLPLFTGEPLVKQAVYLSVLASCIQVLANLYACLFTAFEDTLYLAISVFIERGVFLVGVILVVLLHWGFLAIFWMQVASFVIKWIFCAAVVRLKFARIVWTWEGSRLRYYLKESLPLLFSTGFRTLDQQLDTFLLQLLQTAAELGLYGAPYRIISRLNIIPDSVMAGLLPALSNMVETPTERARAVRLYDKLFKYFLTLSLPIAVLVTFSGEPIMVLLFGPDFRAGAPALSIMVWVVVFMFPNYLFKYILTAIGQQHLETISLAASLVAHLGVGLWLIPAWGSAGGALAWLVAQIVAFAIGLFYVSRSFGSHMPWKELMKILIGALPAVTLLVLWTPVHPLIRLLGAGAVYMAAMIVLGVFQRDEILFLLASLRPARMKEGHV